MESKPHAEDLRAARDLLAGPPTHTVFRDMLDDRDLLLWALMVGQAGSITSESGLELQFGDIEKPEPEVVVIVPTEEGGMPDFVHPAWPAARDALAKLREEW